MSTPRPPRAQPARAAQPSRAALRRTREANEGRAERRIYIVAAVVAVAVAVIIAAGVLLTVVLPPRAEVVTVGPRTLTASDIAVRAKYAAVVESNTAAVSDPATVIPAVVREETLRQKAAALGVSVSDDDLKAELRKRVGTAEDQSDDVFRAAYDRYAGRLPISRADFEEIVRAALLRTKAVESFKAQVPERGPQVHLLAVSAQSRTKLDEMRVSVAAGKDFKDEAVARGLVKDAAAADLAWFDPASLPDRISAVRDLQSGQLSEVIMDSETGSYLLVQAAERSEDRVYDDPVKGQVASRLFEVWAKEQEAALVGQPSLSGNAETWVRRQVRDAVASAQRRAEAQQAQP